MTTKTKSEDSKEQVLQNEANERLEKDESEQSNRSAPDKKTTGPNRPST